MKLKKTIAVLSLFLLASGILCAAPRKGEAWALYSGAPDCQFSLEEVTPEGFILDVLRSGSAEKATVLVCTMVNREYPADARLSFTCRSVHGTPAVIQVLISCRENGKNVLKFGPKVSLTGSKVKKFSFHLGKDLHIASEKGNVAQLKLSFNASESPVDRLSAFEVGEVRFEESGK